MNWTINKDYNYTKHPLFLVDGKIIGKDRKLINVKPEELSTAEFINTGDVLKKYGEDGKDGIVNFVTKKNKDSKAAHVFVQKISFDSSEMQKFIKEAAILNKLYIGMENPLKISAEEISNNDIIVKMDEEYGSVKKKNGLYYALPKKPGNAEIKVFKKEKDGTLKLLNSRYFRVEYLPNQVSIVHFNNL